MSAFDSIKYQVPELGTDEYIDFMLNVLPDGMWAAWQSHPEFQITKDMMDDEQSIAAIESNKKLLERIIYNWEIE